MLAVKHLSAFGAFWMQSIQSDLGAYAGLSRVPVTLCISVAQASTVDSVNWLNFLQTLRYLHF